MGTYTLDVSGDGSRYSYCVLRQDFYSWLIENEISANDIKWDFDEYIKKWSKKKTDVYSVSDELTNNEFNGPSLSQSTSLEVIDDDSGKIVFSTKLDKKSLEKYQIKVSRSEGRNSFVNGTKLIVETGSQGDVYLNYRLETDSDFDPSKLVIEFYESDDDALIVNIDYKDTNSDINIEDTGYDDKGCSPEYVVVDNEIEPEKSHSFNDSKCSDWFDISIKPIRNGFYEVKKCDEEVSPILLKWKKNSFYRQQEDHKYDKNWNIKSTKIIDIEVPYSDVSCWRGLKKTT